MISKMNMKKVTLRFGIFSLLLTSLLLTSCKDWDEHYDAGSAVEGSATATIWENITANANLSQFAALVQKAGYEEMLKSTQTLTVWAPLNDTFDFDALMDESNETLRKEFVQNHIARNNYPASGSVERKISMLNLKHLVFEGNGNYTMDGIAVAQPNVASINGVIHTLNGKLQFRSNILESLNNKEFPIDSVSNYVHDYDEMVFNEMKSTKGPVVDGQITYLDSIYDEYNLICQRYAYINREDSNYSMIVPSNEAWTKAVNYIKQCYNYVNFTYCDNPDSIKEAKYKKGQVNFDPSPEYWRDSISYGKMLEGLFYNNNLYDNKKLKDLTSGEIPQVDSLMTTTHTFIYGEDARNLFAGTTRVEKSNGAIYVTDGTLNMQPWLFWNPLINIEAEYYNSLASVVKGSTEYARAFSDEQNENVPGTVSNGGYLVALPSSSTANVELYFHLRNMRSTTYVVYGVFVPPHITNLYIQEENIKPNQVQVQVVSTNDANGKLITRETTLSRTVEVVNEDGTTTKKTINQFNNDPNKVDTVCFGEITFPICYYGMTGSPYLRILSRVPTTSNTLDRTIRLDRIFLVPKELDDYLKAHPDYKVHY